MKELKGTIYIAYLYTKDGGNQEFPSPGVELAHPGILTVKSVAQYGIEFLNEWKERRKVVGIEVPIRACEEGEVPSDCLEASDERRAIALVEAVVEKPHLRIRLCNSFHNGL